LISVYRLSDDDGLKFWKTMPGEWPDPFEEAAELKRMIKAAEAEENIEDVRALIISIRQKLSTLNLTK
jgi:hypothetical protein